MSFLLPTGLKYHPYFIEGIFPGILFWLKCALQTIVVIVTVARMVYGQQIQIESQSGHPLKYYKHYHGMVVGVGQYRYWPQKPNAVRDARDISRVDISRKTGLSQATITGITAELLGSIQ